MTTLFPFPYDQSIFLSTLIIFYISHYHAKEMNGCITYPPVISHLSVTVSSLIGQDMNTNL